MTQKIQKFWDKQARRYDRGERQFSHVYKDIMAKTSQYLDANDNALDFGCATGTKTIALATKVKHMHGLDISSEMIHEANKKKEEAQISNISFSNGTLFNTNFEKSSFDKIIAYSIIHLLEDKERVMQRIHELLKPGGLFISITACMKDKMALKNRMEVCTYLLLKRLGMFPLHLNLFKSEDVERFIADQNFQIVEAEKIVYRIPAVFIVAKK